jgi:hypothetical protein
MPFANDMERELHFWKHGEEFGAVDAMDYERMADGFLYDPLTGNVHECNRTNGRDRVRFDFGTYIEGVACLRPDFIRTFFVVSLGLVNRHGGPTGYFAHECNRVNL